MANEFEEKRYSWVEKEKQKDLFKQDIFEIHIPESEDAEVIRYVFSSCGFLFDTNDEYPYYEITVGDLAKKSSIPAEGKGHVKAFSGILDYEFNHLIGEIRRKNKREVLL